jgi:hypothetical protein
VQKYTLFSTSQTFLRFFLIALLKSLNDKGIILQIVCGGRREEGGGMRMDEWVRLRSAGNRCGAEGGFCHVNPRVLMAEGGR